MTFGGRGSLRGGGIFLVGGREEANFQLVGRGTPPIPPVGKTQAVVTKYGKSHSLLSETAVITYGNPSTAY